MSRLRPLGVATGCAALALALLAASPATAVAPPLSDPHVLVHFDPALGQLAENIALEPDGSADVTFIGARQVARVGLDGSVTVRATLPPPTDPDTPVVHFPAATGLARAEDGTLYIGYATGDELAGVWRLTPGGDLTQLAGIPNSLINGLTLDEHKGTVYAADSGRGVVWRVSTATGEASVWASGADLEPAGFVGANGVRKHHGAIWVSNSDKGTVLRIPICPDGTSGPVETRITGLDGIDDFGFTSFKDDALLAALNTSSRVAYVTADGVASIVLTAADGLSNPTSVAVDEHRVYVTSASFFATPQDPNLLLARLDQ
ncbi:SMP-30/gluconolactonase/LRE family protein [Kitasatospora sp. NPDC048365]|uniref:SMP-30/gluconolactonase/LRE family protein n=1 Tax=Kitasatospora sp. NPDC048365 TaxID=3364050 RepID=UPI0037177873